MERLIPKDPTTSVSVRFRDGSEIQLTKEQLVTQELTPEIIHDTPRVTWDTIRQKLAEILGCPPEDIESLTYI